VEKKEYFLLLSSNSFYKMTNWTYVGKGRQEQFQPLPQIGSVDLSGGEISRNNLQKYEK
jgi:hypothetical protein